MYMYMYKESEREACAAKGGRMPGSCIYIEREREGERGRDLRGEGWQNARLMAG
jgi:hypothetical protein